MDLVHVRSNNIGRTSVSKHLGGVSSLVDKGGMKSKKEMTGKMYGRIRKTEKLPIWAVLSTGRA